MRRWNAPALPAKPQETPDGPEEKLPQETPHWEEQSPRAWLTLAEQASVLPYGTQGS